MESKQLRKELKEAEKRKREEKLKKEEEDGRYNKIMDACSDPRAGMQRGCY